MYTYAAQWRHYSLIHLALTKQHTLNGFKSVVASEQAAKEWSP